MASEHSPWPLPAEAPAAEDLARCVHCGLCVNACPTYAITGLEVESPRGRIALAKGIEEGAIPLTAAVQGHWDLCLQCRACETACPSGVPYGRIIEHARAQVNAAPPKDGFQRSVRRQALRRIVARPRMLAAALWPARVYAGSPLRTLVRRAQLLKLLGRLATPERQLPHHQGSPFRPGQPLARPVEELGQAILFTGCIMGELFGDVHRATGRVLARSGIQAVATPGQGCCGALSAHDGDLDFARKLARANIAALEADSGTPIVVNSAGCGAAMKEYGDLLHDEPRWAARARAFGARVKDLSEYLVSIGAEIPAGFEGRVAYQDACHLVHAQRIREQPRDLLRAAGCDLVETQGADMCCGAAGLYSLVQPEMSAQLRARKTEQFKLHRPDVIVTANPGCQMQYQVAVAEAGLDARVLHVAEALDEAYRRADAREDARRGI